ncbi:hypothetical protein [Streptomyces ossamyceticus]|uniref:hypothetical protein n=1 Tax=Streptomyces ossamyceticus TaxID=249581 RepID=UPI00342291ED
MLEWQTPELMVQLRCRKLTRSPGHDLALPEAAWHSREAVTTALGVRRQEIAAFIAEDPPSSVPSLALVEIDRAADFTSPDHKSTSALSREENAACLSEFCDPSLPTRVGPWSVGERVVSSEAQLRACMGTGHMT